MSKLLNLLLCLVLAGAFVGCSETKEEQAQDRASVLVDEQNSIVSQLRTMGYPTASWSESQLTRFENLLNDLDRVEEELGSLNGTNGITIYGNNASTIPSMRRRLATVRSQRAAGSIGTMITPSVPVQNMGEDDDGPAVISTFETVEDSEREQELEDAISAFKSENSDYLSMDYREFTYEELLTAKEAIEIHVANITEYHEILMEKQDRVSSRVSQVGRQSEYRGLGEALGFMVMVDVMTAESDLTQSSYALSMVENEIEIAKTDGRAEDYLMQQSVTAEAAND